MTDEQYGSATRHLGLVIAVEDYRILKALAKERGTSVAEVVRTAIRDGLKGSGVI